MSIIGAVIMIFPIAFIFLIFFAVARGLGNSANFGERKSSFMRDLKELGGQGREGNANAAPHPYMRPPQAGSNRQQPQAKANNPAAAIFDAGRPRTYDDPGSTYTSVTEYSHQFREAYYRAQAHGRDFDPWDLPPERGPWEI